MNQDELVKSHLLVFEAIIRQVNDLGQSNRKTKRAGNILVKNWFHANGNKNYKFYAKFHYYAQDHHTRILRQCRKFNNIACSREL